LKNIYLLKILLLIATSFINAEVLNDIKIKSDKVEFKIDINKINFLDNVSINSKYISISANTAVYDDKNKVINLSGAPSKIESSKENNVFYGLADKILFFNNERVHLIGNATMQYDGISITSNLIIFNPVTGNISTE